MRPVCHLHIGMNKAGSTSIQHAFDGYLDEGLEYLQRPGAANATFPVVLGYRDRPPRRLIPTGADIAELRAEARTEFEDLLARSDRAALVSSEYLSHFPSVENARDLVGTIRRSASEVRVLSYLRPPRAFVRSVLQQLLKQNAPPDDLSILWPAYGPRHERWREAVEGEGTLTCVAFRRDQFAQGDLLADICARVGADPATVRSVPPQNTGLSLEACAVLAAWQSARGGTGISTEPLVSALQSFGDTRDWGFSAASMDDILASRRDDLDWAARATGCPDFAEEREPESRIDGVADLISQADGLTGALESWAARVAPAARPAARTVPAILDATHAALSGRPPPPAPPAWSARRVARAVLRRLGARG